MLWSKTHAYTLIPSIMAYAILGFFIAKPLKEKSDKFKLIPIHIITVIIIVLEIIKQILGIIKGYDFSFLPLHFCSLFLFLFSAISLYQGKYKDKVRLITLLSCGLLLLASLIFPNLIYNENTLISFFNYFFNFHTVIYHNLVLFGFFIMINLNLVEFKNSKANYISIIIFFGLYSLIVTPIALITNYNFNNICRCQIPAIETIRVNWNNTLGFAGQLIYDSIINIGIIVFACALFTLFVAICKLYKRIKNKI